MHGIGGSIAKDHRIRIILSLLLLLLVSLSARAQTPPENQNPQTSAGAKQTTEYTLPPDKLRQSEALYRLDMKFAVLGTLYSWLVLLAVLRWGMAARFRDWAE